MNSDESDHEAEDPMAEFFEKFAPLISKIDPGKINNFQFVEKILTKYPIGLVDKTVLPIRKMVKNTVYHQYQFRAANSKELFFTYPFDAYGSHFPMSKVQSENYSVGVVSKNDDNCSLESSSC